MTHLTKYTEYDMTKHTDTLVIGAGPAGISAAITLQKAGIPNIVIDKSSFPREKVCGGLVTNKTLKALMRLLNVRNPGRLKETFADHSDTVEIYDKNKRLTCSKVSKYLRFVKRNRFDFFLVKQYKSLGGTIYENEKNYQADFSKQEIRLTDGNIIYYDHLIVADGALSVSRTALGLPGQELSFCIEAYAPKIQIKNPDRTKVYFGIIDNGYAWVFPSGEEVCIGLGGEYDKNISYIKILKDFLNQLSLNPDGCRIRGAFVPSGAITVQSSLPENVSVIGDAGGFVDPIYGEGLYFALSSGIAAAKSRISSPKSFKNKYLKMMAGHIKMISHGYRLKKIFFKKRIQEIFKKRIGGKDSFVSFYCDNQVSTYRYSYRALFRLYVDYKKRVFIR